MAADAQIVIGANIELDAFNKACETINQTISRTSKATIEIEPSTKGVKTAQKDLDKLNEEIKKQTDEVFKLGEAWDEYQEFVAQGGQELEGIADAYRKPFDEAYDALDGLIAKQEEMAGAIAKAGETIEKGTKETKELGDETKNTGEEMKKTSKDADLLKTAMSILSTIGVVGLLKSLVQTLERTKEFRKELSFLEQNAKDAGRTLDEAGEYMVDFAGVSSNAGEKIAAVSALLAAGFDDNEMAKAIGAVSGAIVSMPGVYKIDTLSESLQKAISQGKATEQFADLVNRSFSETGITLEEFNKKMSSLNSEAARQDYVLKYLAKTGLAEANEGYRENNKALIEAAEQSDRYEKAIAGIADILQPFINQIMEAKTQMAEWAAETPFAVELFTGLAIVLGMVTIAISGMMIISKVKSAFAEFFGGAKNAAEATKELTKGVKETGKDAGQAAQNFLLYAVGIAVVAVAVAVLVLAISELVKAFGGSDESALLLAAAIAIILVAIGGMLALLASLFSLTKDNATQFVIFAAGIAIIAVAVSLMTLSLTLLIKELNASDESIMDVAVGVIMIVGAMTGAIAIISFLGAALGSQVGVLLMFGAAVLVIAMAFLVLAAAIALIRGDFRNMQLSTPTAPSVGELQGKASKGYAYGTESARRGWNMIDETTGSPRLAWFGGGEKVLTTSQTMANSGMSSSNRGESKTYVIQNISIPANEVRQFNDVIRIMETEAAMIGQGYVKE